MAHALNLLLQGWSLPQWASSVVEDAHKIVRFIRARHVPLALFRKHAAIHAKGLSLLSPGATRFATNFLMVARRERGVETNNHRCRVGYVRQDLVQHAEETYTNASTGAEEVDTRR
jgi:hypothetical protein